MRDHGRENRVEDHLHRVQLAGHDEHAAHDPQRGDGGDVRERVVEGLVEEVHRGPDGATALRGDEREEDREQEGRNERPLEDDDDDGARVLLAALLQDVGEQVAERRAGQQRPRDRQHQKDDDGARATEDDPDRQEEGKQHDDAKQHAHMRTSSLDDLEIVWQRPLARRRTGTSRGPTAPSVTSSTTSGWPASWRTSARNAILSEALDGRASVEDLALALHDGGDRKSTRLNSSHVEISYAVFCLKKKKSMIAKGQAA